MAVVRAKASFHYGESGMLTAGELWAADDPLVKAHPDWFDTDLDAGARRSSPKKPDPPVEAATAAPGEKRTTRRS